MTRYYFHVRTAAGLEEDPDGIEFASLSEANDDAVQAAREIIAEKVLFQEMIETDRFEITAEDGTLLIDIPFRSALILK